MKILVLESSTTSAKAMLYDTQRSSWSVLSRPYEFGRESQAIQDPVRVFLETAAVAKELAAGSRADIILQSTTWHSVMLCDFSGTPLTPVELWCYTGADQLCSALRTNFNFVESYYRSTGCLVNSTYPYFKLMNWRDKGTLNYSVRIGGQGVYDMFRLTGEWVTTDSMASGSGLLNIRTGTYDSLLLASSGIHEEQLPRIASYGETFPLTKTGAELLGQQEGIPVVPAYPDGALNQIGAGALKNGIMTFSVGTSAAIRVTVKDPVLPDIPSLWSYRVPSAHLLGAATSGACNCQDWVKKNFFPDTTYAAVEKSLSCNRDTPVFLPFLFGERCPGWLESRRGGFENLNPNHTPSDLYQSVLEGVLFNVYQCYTILVKTAGEPDCIKLSGGILRSSVWTTMCADIFGKKMTIDKEEQSSVMGGAVIGLHILGELESLEAFSPESDHVVEPNTEAHLRYAEKYARYLEAYDWQGSGTGSTSVRHDFDGRHGSL